MAGMARLDLIDAGRAQAGQQRRPFGVQRGQFALQRGKSLPPGSMRSQPTPGSSSPPPPSAAVARRPPVRGRPAAPARPAPIGTTVAATACSWARRLARWLSILRSCRSASGTSMPTTSALSADPCAISSSAAFSAPSRRSVSASSWRNCCSRSRRSACACAAVGGAASAGGCASRCCARASGARTGAGAGRLRLLFQRPQFGFILLVAPDLILQQAQVAGGLRQLAAQAFQRSRCAPGRPGACASTARASSAFQGSACCACPCSWRRAASRSTSASNCALARKRHRAPTARAPTPHRHPEHALGLRCARPAARRCGHALEQLSPSPAASSPDRRVALADGPGRGPPARERLALALLDPQQPGMPACSGLLCPRPGKSKPNSAASAFSAASPSRRSAPPSISSSQRAFVRNCFFST